MAVIGTFGQFTTARLAIYASQASLSVTGNNIANINTTGYTRQRMDLVSLYSTGQGKYANIFNTNVGYGVLTRGATQLRDPYLDIRYRNENAKLGANEEKLNGLYQIGSILDEVNKGEDGFGVIEGQFNKLMEALEDENTNIGSEEYDKLVRSAASVLATYFNKAADDLADIKTNKINELKESIADVNKLLTEIRDLNSQIRTQNIYGDKALELKDARNLALDKLSGYMHIEVKYSMERIDQFSEVEKLTVSIAGSRGPDGQPIKLVDGIYGGQISMPEMMPTLNPNADQKKIVDAMNAEREKWEQHEPWIQQVTAAAAAARTQAENDPDLKKPVDDARAAAQAAAEAKYPDTVDDYQKKREEFIKNYPALKKAEEARTEAISAAEGAARAKAEAERQQKIQAEVDTVREDQEKIYGRYLQADGVTATDKWEVDDQGQITSSGSYFNYDEDDPDKSGTRYLMKLERLVDQRGRVTEDRNDPSGKSQAVALTDTTFCDSYVNPDGTVETKTALGSIQAIREMLTREGEYSSEDDINRDVNSNTKRGIPYYERALDNLARKFAQVFNEANQISLDVVYDTAAAPVDKDGNPVLDANGNAIAWADVTETITDSNGDQMVVFIQKPDAETAKKIEQVRAQAAKNPGYGFYDGGVLISNRGDNNDPTNITAANFSISDAWGNHTVRLLNTRVKSEVDANGNEVSHTTRRDNITHIIDQFTRKRDYFAQEVQADAHATLPVFHGSFQEVFTAISGVLADDTEATEGKTENYSLSTLDLENSRQSVSGVDLNDEATNMMQFSKSYAAACRLLTTIDSMLDTLINGTAR